MRRVFAGRVVDEQPRRGCRGQVRSVMRFGFGNGACGSGRSGGGRFDGRRFDRARLVSGCLGRRGFDGGRFGGRCFDSRRFESSCLIGACFDRRGFDGRRFGSRCSDSPGFERSRFIGECFGRRGFDGRRIGSRCFDNRGFERSRFIGECFCRRDFDGGRFGSRRFEIGGFGRRCFDPGRFYGSRVVSTGRLRGNVFMIRIAGERRLRLRRVLVDERFRRIEDLPAVPAAHQPAVQHELFLLQAEDGFAMGAARRKKHVEPGGLLARVKDSAILMAFAPGSGKANPTFVLAPDRDVDVARIDGRDFVRLAREHARQRDASARLHLRREH